MSIENKYGSYPDEYAKYVRATNLVDTDHGFIRKQSNELTKDAKTALQAITTIHSFVAKIPLGYDKEDKPASYYLKKMRGQCNTKTTLFLALLRNAGIPCRVHAWKVKKFVHKKRFPLIIYLFTPKTTLFIHPEIYYKKKWQLLTEVLTKKPRADWDACPFDNADKRKRPLRDDMIAEDLGSFWNPDLVYSKYGTNVEGWKQIGFPLVQLLLNKK